MLWRVSVGRDAKTALTSAPTAVRSVRTALMSSVRPVTCAESVQARICGARSATDAVDAPKYARTAERSAVIARSAHVKIAASVKIAL